MESDEFYYKNIKELFPTSLYDFVDFNLSPNVFEKVCGITMSFYQNIPTLPYEFVFVDGPPAFDLVAEMFEVDFKRIYRNRCGY